MGLAAVVIEKHAWRAVHLRHNHTFGTIDHEGPVRGHQGHVAHEDILFFNVLDRFRAGVFVDIKHDQPQGHLERTAISHVTLLTFLDIIFWLFKIIAHKFQHAGLVEILDRKHRLKNTLYTFAIHRDRLISRR